jgi:hypothetical protein
MAVAVSRRTKTKIFNETQGKKIALNKESDTASFRVDFGFIWILFRNRNISKMLFYPP